MTFKTMMMLSSVERVRDTISPETVERVSSFSDCHGNGNHKGDCCVMEHPQQQQQSQECDEAQASKEDKTTTTTRTADDRKLSWLVQCGFEIEFDPSNPSVTATSPMQTKIKKTLQGHDNFAAPALDSPLPLPLRLLRDTSGASERSAVTFADKLDTLHVWDAQQLGHDAPPHGEDENQGDAHSHLFHAHGHGHAHSHACSASVDSSFADVRSESGEDTYFSQSFHGPSAVGNTSFFTFAEEEEYESNSSSATDTSTLEATSPVSLKANAVFTPMQALSWLEEQQHEDCCEGNSPRAGSLDGNERRNKNLSQHSYFSAVDGQGDEEEDMFTSCRSVQLPSPSASPLAASRRKQAFDHDHDDNFLLPFYELDDDASSEHSETTFLNGVSFDEHDAEEDALSVGNADDDDDDASLPPVLLPPREFQSSKSKNIFQCLFCPSWK